MDTANGKASETARSEDQGTVSLRALTITTALKIRTIESPA
jgi:hypothetical protein